jgi:hypothetical protein
MTSTDLFQQRVKECRRLAAAARKASDRVFWLGLIERWQAVESRTARRPFLRQGPLAGDLQQRSPGRRGQAAGASPAHAERRSQRRSKVAVSYKKLARRLEHEAGGPDRT